MRRISQFVTRKLLIFVGCCLLLLPPLGLAHPQAYVLDNGLKLVVNVDKRSPLALFMIWYKVGSSYEPAGQSGLSHMLEHMMFRGTAKHPADEFTALVGDLGGVQNAFTGHDFTVYYQKWHPDHLSKSFYYEADRMRNLVLDSEIFRKENNIVQEERRSRSEDNAIALTYERLMAGAHLAPAYRHPVIGWMADIENMTIEDLKSWYAQWYVPNNAIIVISGHVEPKQMLAYAKQYFGEIPAQALPQLKPQTTPPPLGEKIIKVEAPANLPHVYISFNVPSLNTAEPTWEAYALDMLATVLDGGDSARFAKNIIRDQQLAVAISTQYSLYSRLSGLFTIGATPGQPDKIEALKTALLTQIEQLQTSKVDAKELARIRAQAIAAKVYQQDSLFGQAFIIGHLEAVNLPWQTHAQYIDAINSITAEQLQQVAQKYFTPKNRTIAYLQPLIIHSETTPISRTPEAELADKKNV